MSDFWQQIIVGTAVLGAIIYLVRRGRKSSCEKGGCCPTKKYPLSKE